MFAIITVLIILLLSLTATRVATVALTLTGLSSELARFQARSAFTGCGFTTAESERLMDHPVRRRILMALMLLGNAGIVTSISSLILAFARESESQSAAIRMGVLAAGVIGLWLLSASSWVARWMERVIRWALRKWTHLELRDYASLLRLSDDFTVCELEVEEDDWVVDKSLIELDLHREGVTVLGVQRKMGGYVGVPRGQSRIRVGDILLLYGCVAAINDLDTRPSGTTGDEAHQQASQAEADRLRDQETGDKEREAARGPADR